MDIFKTSFFILLITLPTITIHTTPHTLQPVLLWDLRRHMDAPQTKAPLGPQTFFYQPNKIFPIVYSLLFPPTDDCHEKVQHHQRFDRYMQEYQQRANDLRNSHTHQKK